MPLFYNAKSILFLQSKSLDLYNDEAAEGVRVVFPPEVVDHLEIKNSEAFEKLVAEFFVTYNLKDKVCVLVLAESTLFQKTIKPKSDEDVSEQIKTFFEEIPLDSSKVLKKQLPTDEEILLLSTNKDLFEEIVKVAVEQGAKVDAVVPASLFEIDPKKDQLSLEDIKQILKQPELIKTTNFLVDTGENQFVDSIDPEHRNIMTRHFPTILLAPILIVIITIGILVYLWFASDYLKIFLHLNPQPAKSTIKVSTTSSPVATSSATASVSAQPIDKKSLKIEVLNGTEVAGLAKKLGDQLTSEGYGSIKLGNAPNYTSDDTQVVFGSQVPDETKAELIQLLKKSFVSVKGQDDSTLKSFDLVITEGKPITS